MKMLREVTGGREAYERAAQIDADALMALLTAQCDVDQALGALSEVRDEVSA